MNNKIKNALIALLNDEVTVASWGISNITIKESSFEFMVSGFVYQGKVSVSIHNSVYLVTLDNGCSEECDLDNLVQYLDSIIEKTPNYDIAVLKWLEGQC